MNQNQDSAEIANHGQTDEMAEHIHMPSPSWSPIILALGMAAAAFGVVLGGVVLIVGVILLAIGLGTWVYDEIKHAALVDAEEAHANPQDTGQHSIP